MVNLACANLVALLTGALNDRQVFLDLFKVTEFAFDKLLVVDFIRASTTAPAGLARQVSL